MWASPNVSAYLHVDSTDYIVQYMLHGLSTAYARGEPEVHEPRDSLTFKLT